MSEPVTPAEHKWREVVARQQASGLSITAFCRENAVPASSFFAWKRRLFGRGPGAGGEGRAAARPGRLAAGTFVEAKLVSCGPSGAIEVHLRGGGRVIVRRGFDRELLAQVVAALEGRPLDPPEGRS